MRGITRRRRGKSFFYVDTDGSRVRSKAVLQRIRALAIPPAYRDVWICPLPSGHLQATGRDARGRKQYRYHPKWREVRDEAKFHRLVAFGRVLPKIRAAVRRDLPAPALPRRKVLAAVVALLEATAVRVGNEEYARANGSFGLTTLRARHVRLHGTKIEVRFRGKTGREHAVAINDARIARILRRCRDLPGEELFTYAGDAGARLVSSEDVNDYLREISGGEFTAKDFRTWIGTLECARALARPARDASEAKENVNAALARAAARLGNTVAVCRKAYVHPALLQAYARDLRLPASLARERAMLRFIARSARASPQGS